MDQFQRDFIEIIYAAFEQPRQKISSDFDFEKAVKLAKAHNIAAIVYYGALNCGMPADTPYMQELFTLTCHSMMISQRQMYEIGRLEEAYEQAGIEYMPLKGTVLKALYPQPEMRTMGDADILIKLEQYPQIEPIMEGLGYRFERDYDHELVWKNASLYLELHKRVVPSNSKDFYRYFGTGWQLGSRLTDLCRYEMSPENLFLYIFVHFTKHYRSSGIGMKHLLDLWVVIKRFAEMDLEYVCSCLKEMKLYDFYTYTMETVGVWFDGAEENDRTNLITNVIFNSGQYGTHDRGVVNRAILAHRGSSARARCSELLLGIFLPYGEMKKRYGVLAKAPILLPIFWVVRWFEILFFRRYVFKIRRDRAKIMTQDNMDQHRAALQFVGLDVVE